MSNKIRYHDYYGLDRDQVLAWRRVFPQKGICDVTGHPVFDKDDWYVEVYIPGNKIIFKNKDEGFYHLINALYKKFILYSPEDDCIDKNL
ncbi:hypothetical protein QUA41_17650 [Microcoleus sp. Pol11C1]|uniref:hypothetical protein n=1 Tax=unclassified Microcoleus TaxID=2642155 RepID=UPI002FD58F08